MHQNEWFQVWFFKNFLGRGSPSPLPRPLPPLFLGLRPRFGLRPQFSGASRPRLGLRPRYSGASRPRFGLRPQLSIGDLGLAPPKNKFLDPAPVLCHAWLVGKTIVTSYKLTTRVLRGLGHVSPLPTSVDNEWLSIIASAKHYGVQTGKADQNKRRPPVARCSLQFRYINNHAVFPFHFTCLSRHRLELNYELIFKTRTQCNSRNSYRTSRYMTIKTTIKFVAENLFTKN